MRRKRFAEISECPLGQECSQCRSKAVEIVKERNVIFSNDLKRELKKRFWWREGATNRALRFLHKVQTDKKNKNIKRDVFGCKHIEAWRKVEERRTENETNVMYFGEKGVKSLNKLFFLATESPALALNEIRKRLSHVQESLLNSFEKQRFGTYYLSSFETRKLTPYPEGHIRDSLDRLLDIGFLKVVSKDISRVHHRPEKIEITPIGDILNERRRLSDAAEKRLEKLEKPNEPLSGYKLDFLTTPEFNKILENSIDSAVLEERVEYKIVKQIHMRLLKGHRTSVERAAMRTDTLKEMSRLTRGYHFDSYCILRDGSRLGVDVFSRFALSTVAVGVFARKVEIAGCRGRIYTRESLSNEVDRLCKERGIYLVYLKNTSIDYEKVRQETKRELMEAGI